MYPGLFLTQEDFPDVGTPQRRIALGICILKVY
jgi:hypothetical protein